ncbi:MAG: hypothetical protein KKG47_11250 [Proteobacteria bacterium]|nr:hypothetical protein [Pseudomonadota bacterium]MBU1739390.1 hypothetical protein [Pseudomonadota bacterium]
MAKNQVRVTGLTLLYCLFSWPPMVGGATGDASPADLGHRYELPGHTGRVAEIVFLPGSDRYLVSAGYDDKTVRLWDLRKREEVDRIELGIKISDLAISPDGKTIEALKITGGIKRIALGKNGFGNPRSHWGSAGDYGRLAINSDGRFYAIASRNEAVTVWNAEKRRRHQSYLGTEDYRAVAFAPGKAIFAAADSTDRLAFWDILALEGFGSRRTYRIQGVAPKLGTWDLAFSRDGGQLATSHIDGHVTTWRFTAEKLVASQVHTFDLPQSAFAVVFSPGGEYLFASCQDGSVYRWETASGKPAGIYPGKSGSLLVLALDRRGSTLAAGSLEGRIVFWQK